MGKRGPKPEPKALKVFKGTRFKRPDSLEVLPANLSPPPDWLREKGRAVWVEVGSQLAAVGVLAELDSGAFAIFCDAWDDFFEAQALVDTHGLIVPTDKGTFVANPAIRIKNMARAVIKQYQGEFGLTPSARVDLPSVQGAEDVFEEFKIG